jgi:hypothetical protein
MSLTAATVSELRDLSRRMTAVCSLLDSSDDKQRRLMTKLFENSALLNKFKADASDPQIPLIEDAKLAAKSKTETAR